MPNGSLIIYDVNTEDSGKYTCIAGNSCNIKDHDAFLYVVGKNVHLVVLLCLECGENSSESEWFTRKSE